MIFYAAVRRWKLSFGSVLGSSPQTIKYLRISGICVLIKSNDPDHISYINSKIVVMAGVWHDYDS